MWLDNASNIDMLFYSPYANTIVNFIKEPELTPLTIGLYGSWGAGKSSLLQLIQQNIDHDTKDIVCISLNAWQFEGYEDAKVAIMESLLKSLQSNETFFEKAGEKIKSLLSRIDFLKLGKNILFKGVPYVVTALTGNPIPIAVNLSAELSNPDDIISKLETFKNDYIKAAGDSETQTENVRKFRIEFEKMLAEVTSVKTLVVIVDDLDRCTPDRIIDTLEAIKLFLSVKKTTFIVAVDQRIIEYAVNIKYPQNDGYAVSTDYIEKIIQLPIKIPELSPKDIENYLLLLICQLHLETESFEKLIRTLYDKKLMLADKSLTYTVIESIVKETGGSFKANSNQTSLEEDASIISKISFAVSSSLKGNPRQAKRFLNTFFVRKNLASLYFGAEIDLSVMAKLLALETIDIKAFRKLYEWNSEFDGEIKQLKEVETCINNDKELNENYKLWKNPRVIRWVKSEPKNLYKMDLSKYFYLSRESLSSTETISASFNEAERKMLAAIQNCLQGQEDARLEELKDMEPESQRKICDAVLVHFKSDTINLSMISRVYKEYPDYQSDIVDTLKAKPNSFFGPSSVPHITRMYSANATQICSLLDDLEKSQKISQVIKSQIASGNFAAKAVDRR